MIGVWICFGGRANQISPYMGCGMLEIKDDSGVGFLFVCFRCVFLLFFVFLKQLRGWSDLTKMEQTEGGIRQEA